MMKILFPGFTRWWAEAHDQMLKFPQGAHDDFVDTLSLFGIGPLQRARPAAPAQARETTRSSEPTAG